MVFVPAQYRVNSLNQWLLVGRTVHTSTFQILKERKKPGANLK